MLIALVCFVGLAFPDFAYNFWTFPFVIVFVAASVGCSLDYRTRLARLVLLVMGALIIGIALMMNGLSGINPLAAIAFPLLALALSTTFYRLVRTLLQKSFSLFGRELLHFGIIVLLLGVFISAGTKTMSPSVVATPNSPTDMSPLTTELMQFTFNKASGIVYNEQLNATIPEHSSVEIDAKIQYLGKTYYGSVTADFYPNYGLVLRPLIISTEVGDVYLHLDYSDSLSNALIQALMGHNATLDSVQLSAQISPLIYLVWIGATIMVVGMSAQFIVFLISGYEKKKLWDGLAVAN
jgi:cytochrome c biogenesis factor